MRSLTQNCAPGAGGVRWAGSMLKMQNGLADLQISVFSFEFKVRSRSCHSHLFDTLPKPRAFLNRPDFTYRLKYRV
jgi:hypothetical protein